MTGTQALPDDNGVYIPDTNPVIAELRQQVDNLHRQLTDAQEKAITAYRERDRMEADLDRLNLFVDDIVWTDGPGLSSVCSECGCKYGDFHQRGCKYGAWGQGGFLSRGTVR
jgi:hypothetical protein